MTTRFRPTTPRPAVSESQVSPDAVVDFLGARVHVDIAIPGHGNTGKMRLISRKEEFEIDVEAREWMRSNGYPIDGTAHASPYVAATWHYERLSRILAVAIRDPKNTALALATVDDYRDLDDATLDALDVTYRDLAARLNPIEGPPLEQRELDEIVAAAKKKDVAALMLFGSSRLARFATTSVEPPAS